VLEKESLKIWHGQCNTRDKKARSGGRIATVIIDNTKFEREVPLMKIMVAYDGTIQAKEALVYGMEKAREKGGEVFALHVFNNGLFLDYDVMDAEERARSESAKLVDEARTLIREKGNGVRASVYTTEGNPEEEVISFAKERGADLLLCPPRFKGIIRKYQKAVAAAEFEGSANDTAVLTTKAM
jgi:nucleotide-binding universal stress UspA family protein